MSGVPFSQLPFDVYSPAVGTHEGPTQKVFFINNRHSERCLAPGPCHAGLLETIVALATRLVFSDSGIKAAALALLKRDEACPKSGKLDESSNGVGVSDELMKRAISEIRNLEKAPLMTLVIDRETRKITQVCDGPLPKIFLQRELFADASLVQYQALAQDATSEIRVKRDRYIFFLAVVLANDIQLVIEWMIKKNRAEKRGVLGVMKQVPPSPRVSSFVQRLRAVKYTKPDRERAPPSSLEVRMKRGRAGWGFERALFGGPVVRLTDRASEPGFSGLVVMVKQGDVEGYFQIQDQVVQGVVEGRSDWQKCLPLHIQEHSVQGFISGNHPDAVYRPLDGTVYDRYSARGESTGISAES